jgi:hypothetical protein
VNLNGVTPGGWVFIGSLFLLNSFDQNTLAPPSRIGGDQEMKILKDMNEFNDQHEQVLEIWDNILVDAFGTRKRP